MLVETTLLDWVFAGLDRLGRFNVLDVGPAIPQTVEFLNANSCRMYVADLFDSAIIKQQRGLDQDALADRFTKALWMLDEPLHACLLWDFPNYLTPQALKAFNEALSPWVTPHTKAHAFCAVKRSAPLMQHQYGIVSVNEVVQIAAPERPKAQYPHPWRRLVSALDSFEVARGTLRSGGLVEVILRSAIGPSGQSAMENGQGVQDDRSLRSGAKPAPLPAIVRQASLQAGRSPQTPAPLATDPGRSHPLSLSLEGRQGGDVSSTAPKPKRAVGP